VVAKATVDIFGIRVDALCFAEARDTIMRLLSAPYAGCRFVVTPNVNHVVLYQKSATFRQAYSDAWLVLADGRYVVGASRLLGSPLPESVNGSDLVPALFESANGARPLRVFLLGALPGVAERAAVNIERRWPNVEIVGTCSPPFGFEHSARDMKAIVEKVNEAEPDLLVLGLTPPKQEEWISTYAPGLRAKIAICAGATIDFLAGGKRRAPRWAQTMGFEWVYRLVHEPRRLAPRYFRDGVRFARLVGGAMATRWVNRS
jgi:N-acetylglucosaminyldiphosphoundecaprenol N-acetyl-beta-D-mannosaminyltransferase